MSKFTMGPWRLTHVSGSNFAVQRFELRSDSAYPIFQKDTSAIDGGTVCCSPEDARLIAAAPDMHSALVRIASGRHSDFMCWQIAKAALTTGDTGAKHE